MLVVVNLDPTTRQDGFVDLDLDASSASTRPSQYHVDDLLTDAPLPLGADRRNFVQLDPAGIPAHIFSREARGVRSEQQR